MDLSAKLLSEAELGRIHARVCESQLLVDNKAAVALLRHVAFLERLLGEADNLPAVRRRGYEQGWADAMARATAEAREQAADLLQAGHVLEGQTMRSLGYLLGAMADHGPEKLPQI